MAILDTAADKRRGISRQRAVEEHHDLFAWLRATVGLVAKLAVPVRGQPLPLLLGVPGVAARRRRVAILAHRLVEGRLGRVFRYSAVDLVDDGVDRGPVAVVIDELEALTQLVR